MSIQVGILGFAHGHVGSYCKRWKQDPGHGVERVAGWDHDADRLARSAEAFGVQPFVVFDECLGSGLEAVVIGAETSMHAEIVEQAAAAGKAIVLQKPMAEADRIVTAVERVACRSRWPGRCAWTRRISRSRRWSRPASWARPRWFAVATDCRPSAGIRQPSYAEMVALLGDVGFRNLERRENLVVAS